MRKYILTVAVFFCAVVDGLAQNFFNLTADEVKIDSLLPVFTHLKELDGSFQDSLYSVSIDYPEFVPMTETDIRRYHAITSDSLPALPVVSCPLAVARKKGMLDISFVPLVFRDGKYQKLVSFKLTVKGEALPHRLRAAGNATSASSRYADHSVLRLGNWAKIRVKESGVYQLTESLVRQAGFSDLSKIKIYGYGGALQPEKLDGDYLSSTDDLTEVASCMVGGKRLFYAQGPVTWNANGARTRNPYSDYGYYFITQTDGTPLTVDSLTFVDGFYPTGDDYNSLYEKDDYSWEHDGFHGGRNLYDSKLLELNTPNDYTLSGSGTASTGTVRVVLSAKNYPEESVATVSVNDSVVGRVHVPKLALIDYDGGNSGEASFKVSNLTASNKITITKSSGGDMRLDYIALKSANPRPMQSLSSVDFPSPEYVYRITNQDHHADAPVDMVIIIPTSQTLLSQAERLKKLHETHDGMTVRIVPADELYNEFSSGTPDATAYRRYLKMFYDKAQSDADIPRYLVLFGDAVWDNRMLTSSCRGLNPDDFLLCFEGENSFSQVNCFVSDDFFCLLDDGEDVSNLRGKPDVAVGRISARTIEQATTIVDKTEAYIANKEAGSWKNTFVVMGDDGNNNVHMIAADTVGKMVERMQPAINVKRIMWDAYNRETSSTGFRYPDAEAAVKKYMANGALVLNYNGHGAAGQISHELVLNLNSFTTNTTKRLPLWVTASCDIAPFDGVIDNIGEAAMYNNHGGAVAFYGTTRTVYTGANLAMNRLFTHYLFSKAADGGHISIGEAARLAKVGLVVGVKLDGQDKTSTQDASMNKLHYVLLGDPALVLAYPDNDVVIDSINGVDMTDGASVTLKAGSVVKVHGHIVNDGQLSTDFSGKMSATVFDAASRIKCKLNNPDPNNEGSSSAYEFSDRQTAIYTGSDSVRNGLFDFSFVVPKDISYSQGSGRLTVYAVNSDATRECNGFTENIYLNGSVDFKVDSLGPNIYCYLNSSSFVNGGNVNTTPYFFAEVSDEDGINVSGSGVGHDMQLVIDGELSKTYILNDNFAYDFGSYRSGTVGYSIPALEPGPHKLQFRAWDVLNNSSTTELSFNVVEGISPELVGVECVKNPAVSSTTFRIIHDRTGCEVSACIDVFDMSGRKVWSYSESGVQSSNTLSVDWDLTTVDGRRLDTGVYLYRASVSCDGGNSKSQTKKLIVLSNK